METRKDWKWASARLRAGMRLVKQCERSTDDPAHRFLLKHPASPWYVENAERMAAFGADVMQRLELAVGVTFPRSVECYAADEEVVTDYLDGPYGTACDARPFGSWIHVACIPGSLKSFEETAAHELAHVLSFRIGRHDSSFKSEGFACWAPAAAGVPWAPLIRPVHRYLAALVDRGYSPDLRALWTSHELTTWFHPEEDHRALLEFYRTWTDDHRERLFYDLAWSFATFMVAEFGKEAYLRFYASREHPLAERLRRTLGLTVDEIAARWYDHAHRAHRAADGSGKLAPRSKPVESNAAAEAAGEP